MWLSWKAYLKQFRVVYIVNAFIKCGLMKCSLLVLRWKYKRLSKIKRYIYNENKAINEFKERCCRLRPYFTPSSNTRLRIFWVGACESQDESGFLQSLRRLGVVTVLYNREGGYGALDNSEVLGGKRVKMDELRRNNDEDLLRGFIQANNNGGVDVLIGQMWAHLFSVEALSKIRSAGVPVINISMDDRLPVHWGMRDGIRMGSIGLSSAVDIVLTTVYESCAWYGVEGCPAIYWPLASDPDLFLSEDDDVKDIDVLFIGNRYGVRGKIVRYLEKNGVKVECYGNGWANGYINARQNCSLSKRAKIILGVGTVGYCSDVYTLKLRDFDALMTGSLYITHRNHDLLKIFKEGEDLECYESVYELYDKIKYYLSHPKERMRIGRAGRESVIANYSWDKHLTYTFKRLGLIE